MQVLDSISNLEGYDLLILIGLFYLAIVVLFVVTFWKYTKDSVLVDFNEREEILRNNPNAELPDYLDTFEFRLASWFVRKIHWK